MTGDPWSTGIIDDDGTDDVPESFGTCCICQQANGTVRNIVELPMRAPVPGTGWGCIACGAPPDGAVAVICDPCLTGGDIPNRLVDIVEGYPAEGKRRPLRGATIEPFGHDYQRHMQQGEMPSNANIQRVDLQAPAPEGAKMVYRLLVSISRMEVVLHGIMQLMLAPDADPLLVDSYFKLVQHIHRDFNGWIGHEVRAGRLPNGVIAQATTTGDEG